MNDLYVMGAVCSRNKVNNVIKRFFDKLRMTVGGLKMTLGKLGMTRGENLGSYVLYLATIKILFCVCLVHARQQGLGTPVATGVAFQNSYAVTGKILSANTNEPLDGATISIQGKQAKVLTNADGAFRILASDSSGVLLISFVGYQSAEINFNRREAGPFTIQLESNGTQLEEVEVSTGYQTLPKERATGSFATPLKQVFDQRISTDVLSKLNGITSGLNFNTNTGNTINGELDISIRGRSTINANDQPLIVVDNFPYSGEIVNINPNDVASVTVLKDAAAASIWGVRAGNGVIVITTKRGDANRTANISLNSNVTWTDKPDLFYNPNYLQSADYIDIEHFLFSKGKYNADLNNTTTFPVLSPAVEIMGNGDRLSPADSLVAINHLKTIDVRRQNSDVFYRKALNRQYALSISGGNDLSKYYISSGYDYNLQSLKLNDFKRITLTANNTFTPVKNLELSTGIYYINSTDRVDDTYKTIANRSYTSYPYLQYSDDLGAPLAINRYFREQFISEAPARGFVDWGFRPLQELGLTDNKTKKTDYRLLAAARYRVTGGLHLDIKYQFQKSNSSGRVLHPEESFAARNLVNQYAELSGRQVVAYNVPLGGYLENSTSVGTSHNFRAQLNFSKRWDRHEVNVLGGYEISQALTENQSATYYGYNDEVGTVATVDNVSLFPLNPAGTASIPSGLSIGGSIDRFRSVFGTGAYTYDDKYVFSFSGRIDGSNYFGVDANQKSVPLWSTGLRWNLEREEFYHVPWLPIIHLTATYGYNGNLDRATTGITTFRYFSRSQLTNITYADLTNIGNPELRWEKSRQIKLGLEFALKENIISGNLEYYFKKGVDLIGNTLVAPSTGLTTFRGNFAGMEGQGFDLVLNSWNLRGKFSWKTSLLLNRATDRVTAYNATINGSQFLAADGLNGKSIVPVLGKPVYSVFSLPFAGLDPQNGDPMGYLNGELSKDYAAINLSNEDNLLYHGPARPTVFGGLSNTFSYRDFSLFVNIGFKLGYYFRNNSIDYYQLFGNNFRAHRDYLDRWKKPGDEQVTHVPSMVYPANLARDRFYGNSSVLIEKGDHIRLQDISLSYTFRKARWRALPIQDLQLYIYLNNVGLLWKANQAGLDPDFVPGINSTTYPAPTTYALGLKVNI